MSEPNRTTQLEQELLRAIPDALVVWTDGRGRVVAASEAGARADALARDVDLTNAFLSALGARQQVGEPETLLLTHATGMLVAARLATGGQVAILAARSTIAGLLLSYAQRLAAGS